MKSKNFTDLNKIVRIIIIIGIVLATMFIIYISYSNSKIAKSSKAYLEYISEADLAQCYRGDTTGQNLVEMGASISTEKSCYKEEINKYLIGLTDFQDGIKNVSCLLTKNKYACQRIKDGIDRILYEMNLSMTMYDVYYEMEFNQMFCLYDLEGNLNVNAWESGSCWIYNHDPKNDFKRPLNYLESEDYLGEVKRSASIFAR